MHFPADMKTSSESIILKGTVAYRKDDKDGYVGFDRGILYTIS